MAHYAGGGRAQGLTYTACTTATECPAGESCDTVQPAITSATVTYTPNSADTGGGPGTVRTSGSQPTVVTVGDTFNTPTPLVFTAPNAAGNYQFNYEVSQLDFVPAGRETDCGPDNQ